MSEDIIIVFFIENTQKSTRCPNSACNCMQKALKNISKTTNKMRYT